jgi:hypothetical protein
LVVLWPTVFLAACLHVVDVNPVTWWGGNALGGVFIDIYGVRVLGVLAGFEKYLDLSLLLKDFFSAGAAHWAEVGCV